IAPVIEVDHRPVGTGKVGPLTESMQRIYHEVVRGMRSEYQGWLTPVYADQPAADRKVASNGHSSRANGHVKTRSSSKARTR
ncbi:MAG: hypothetical protein ACM3N4_05295, partial [Nitrososphaerota archaeon]